MSQEELGRRIGVAQNTVSKWEKDESSEPSRKQVGDIAIVLGVDFSALEVGDTDVNLRKLSIMGYAGLGQAVLPLENDAQIDEVAAPAWVPADAGAIIVRGESMRPLYQDGNVLFFWRWTPDPTPFLHREPLVCRLHDGGMIVKSVAPGTPGSGLWTLLSLNAEPLLDQRLHSVAPIELMVRSAHWNS
jgi:transcriptional regulator with XRE-family HTH domain